MGAAVTLTGETGMEKLTAHCRKRLASFKVPAVIHYVRDDE